MPKTKNWRVLDAQVMARPGAAEQQERLRLETLAEYGLYQLRQDAALSQVEVADRLGVTQSAISKLEHAGDVRVSTLQHYIEALGGRLELRACFGDEAVLLHIGEPIPDDSDDS